MLRTKAFCIEFRREIQLQLSQKFEVVREENRSQAEAERIRLGAEPLRLEEAKQMLETTDLPIEAVANEAGYEDTSFFGRLFRRKTGLSPAHYRLRFGSLHQALNTFKKI